METMTQKAMSEEQMIGLVRNALLVAGQEMGDGDQWPVVKDTIYRIAKDYENLKIQRNVRMEMKEPLYAHLKSMENNLSECTLDMREQIAPKLKELREVYDAYFSDVDLSTIHYDPETAPDHIKRMKMILATLEDEHAETE